MQHEGTFVTKTFSYIQTDLGQKIYGKSADNVKIFQLFTSQAHFGPKYCLFKMNGKSQLRNQSTN